MGTEIRFIPTIGICNIIIWKHLQKREPAWLTALNGTLSIIKQELKSNFFQLLLNDLKKLLMRSYKISTIYFTKETSFTFRIFYFFFLLCRYT